MKIKEIEKIIVNLFDTTDNDEFYNESGFNTVCNDDIKLIGYCTNLTVESVEEAKKNNVDLLITHHDAWDFVYGLKDECIKLLNEYNISHYYNHLPLDDSEFGTNESLLKKLALNTVEESHIYEGFYCGRIAEFETEITFKELVNRLEILLKEPVQAWKFNDRKIKRVGLVCGGGGLTNLVKEAVDKECDVYITGEKVLYTIQYAQLKKLNLIIGSHTFTEIFGVESFVNLLSEKSGIQILRINESHLETNI